MDKTPKYNLTYPTPNDLLKDLPTLLESQAESVEEALSGFDFNGQDTAGLASRLTAVERQLETLQYSSPIAISYSTTQPSMMAAGSLNIIKGLLPTLAAEDAVTYANGAFTFINDCIVTLGLAASPTPRNAAPAANERQFLEVSIDYIPGAATNLEYGRSSFPIEDNGSATFSGFIAAGQTLTPLFFTSRSNVSLSNVRITASIQRV